MNRPFPIECDALTFAQSAPESDADRAALVAHLAACPHCAAQVGRDAALTGLWKATRPAEPDEATWAAVWARVSERLDAAEPTEPLPLPTAALALAPAHRWRRHASTAFNVAQAAAILGAVVFWGTHRRPPEPPAATTASASARPTRVEIESGEVVMIHLEGDTVRAVAVGHDEQRPDTLDENLVLFNDAEAMAGTQETFAEMHHDGHTAPPPG